MKRTILIPILFLLFFSLPITSTFASSQAQTIHAVLFFSPSCPACHDVIEEILPPLVEKNADRLDIVGVDVSNPVGQRLYLDMVSAFSLPTERMGVPTMVVGSTVLFGRYEIEEQLPAIIENGLVSQGIDWPPIPGLDQVLASQPTASTQVSNSQPQSSSNLGQPGFITAFLRDPIANSIAVVILFGLILVAVIVLISYLQGPDKKFLRFPEFIIPMLAIIGLGVAIYLSFIEVSGSKAVCGPVGNCNSVQESSFSRLFGLIPIGTIGVIGYIAILAVWLGKTFNLLSSQKFFTLAIWGMAWFGVLFSVYLTFLEPFVIGATCAWCISSAVIMGLMLLSSTTPAKEALRIEYEEDDLEESDLL